MSVNPENVKSWRNGEYIQDCMPYLAMDERELLMSGICGECFDGMFLEDGEEKNEM